ncbi:hypothetical protein ACROYT_G007380 [Oculina patagonica]
MIIWRYGDLKDINTEEEDDVCQAEMEQMVQEVNAVAEHVEGMNVAVENAIKNLRNSADYLDQVWKDCKLASACGSSAGILGGLLTVGGGVATIMTAGAAAPLLIAGTAFSAAGACTNLGTNFIEACTNSSLIQAADGAVENANRAINNVREKIRLLKNGKSQLRLVFVAGLASRMLGANHLAVLFITSLLRPDLLAKTLSTAGTKAVSELALRLGVTEVATAATTGLVETASREAVSVGVNAGARTSARKVGKTGALVARKVGKRIAAKASGKAGTKAGAKVLSKAGPKTASNASNAAMKEGSNAVGKVGTKVGAKSAGSLIIGVSAAFLVLDAMELTFTVRDIINNEGSDAARCLRDRADELEAILHV